MAQYRRLALAGVQRDKAAQGFPQFALFLTVFAFRSSHFVECHVRVIVHLASTLHAPQHASAGDLVLELETNIIDIIPVAVRRESMRGLGERNSEWRKARTTRRMPP
jgi:hypothetical protein